MKVPFSYLERQFADVDAYLEEIRSVVTQGDFTLGRAVSEFESRFADISGIEHAVSVGSGTDAIALSLHALGTGPGDEVITAANTFIATVGAIVQLHARPVFVDSEDGFVIDCNKIEAAITPRTRAIVPVHYTGNLADMPRVMELARLHDLVVVEDACQAIGGTLGDKPAGTWGAAAAFSLHPLKNLNVWGDAGVIVTRSVQLAARLRLLRNHGLVNRDEVVMYGWNSRLDTIQAAVGNRLIGETAFITSRRIDVAARYDAAFADVTGISVPRRRPGVKHVYHLYVLRVERRDELVAYLHEAGIEAKIHYPVPMHLQPAARELGYREGDFPVAEADARSVITLPAHQHLSDEEVDYTIEKTRAFFNEF